MIVVCCHDYMLTNIVEEDEEGITLQVRIQGTQFDILEASPFIMLCQRQPILSLKALFGQS